MNNGATGQKKCGVCEEDHDTSKCSHWSDLNNDKFQLYYQATRLVPKPFCLWCLKEGHSIKYCQSDGGHGCPCESGISKFICCDTEACSTRTNWQEAPSISTGNTKTASSFTMVNGVVMGETTLPIQDIPLPNKKATLRCMFDNCSQSTFILSKTALAL